MVFSIRTNGADERQDPTAQILPPLKPLMGASYADVIHDAERVADGHVDRLAVSLALWALDDVLIKSR